MILTIITINYNNASGLQKTVESVLAKGINYCLLNNANNALSEGAREKVVGNFGVEAVGERYKKLYDSL